MKDVHNTTINETIKDKCGETKDTIHLFLVSRVRISDERTPVLTS